MHGTSRTRFNGGMLAEGGMLAALTVVLALGCTYIPFFQLFTNFVCPLPLTLLALRHGVRLGILAGGVVTVLLGMFLGPQGLGVAVSIAAPGVMLGCGMRKRWSPVAILFGVAVASGAAMGVVALSYGLFLKANFLGDMGKVFEESQKAALEFYERMKLPAAELARQREMLSRATQYFLLALPAIVVGSSILMAFLNYLAARLLLGRLGYPLLPLPSFPVWRAPWWLAWGYLAGLGALWAGESVPAWKPVGVNLFFLISLWYLLQGLAVIAFYLGRTPLPRGARAVVLGLAVLTVGNLLSLGGVLDTWFDFRRLERPKAPLAGGELVEGGSMS